MLLPPAHTVLGNQRLVPGLCSLAQSEPGGGGPAWGKSRIRDIHRVRADQLGSAQGRVATCVGKVQYDWLM